MRIFTILFSAIAILGSAWAGEAQNVVIHLKDKTAVVGEITSLKDGAYTIKTKSLGDVNVPVTSIASIDYEPNKPKEAKAPVATTKSVEPSATQLSTALFGFEDIMQAVVSDPESMKRMESLVDDPDFQSVLNDPEIMKAIEDGNFIALFKNPKIRKLAEKGAVQDITKTVKDDDAVKTEE